MPTLSDVAKYAGVSTATVSKVLSNTPYFTEETRAKVMDAVKALGYRPNLAARALSSGKTHTLAIVFPHIYDTIFQDPLVMQILEGIEMIASSERYNLLLSTPRVNSHKLDENYHQLLQSGYIEGVITIDNVPSASAAQVALDANIPTVVIGLQSSEYNVRNDDYHGGKLQMTHALELGHQDIGIISIESSLNMAVIERMQGMRVVAERTGLTFSKFPIGYGDFSEASGAQVAHKLLSDNPEITAIISINDRMALGAIQAIQAMDMQVPDDMTIIGYDNIPVAAVYSPPLTTVDQNGARLGEDAASMMFELLNDKAPTPLVHMPTLKVRGTSAAPRSS
jgi:DNA-binding LacI/PurR family transcriptional regulator